MTNNSDHFELFNKRNHVLNVLNKVIFTNELIEREKSILHHAGFHVSLVHKSCDAPGVNRIIVDRGDLLVELLPSKGLSIGEAFLEDRPFFWEPPLKGIPNPETLNPLRTLLVNGKLVDGLGFIEAFSGGVEMLGLTNWGIPRYASDGTLQGLHGDVAMRPVTFLNVTISKLGAEIAAELIVYDGAGNSGIPWYKRGKQIFRVTKQVFIEKDVPGFSITDTIQNISGKTVYPDWGYHIQLRPKPGSEYLVPSAHVEMRNGETVPKNHEIWEPAQVEAVREERGVIHKQLKQSIGILAGRPGVETLLKYPDERGIWVVLPPSPYTLSWYSSGGKGGTEFQVPEDGSTPVKPVTRFAWNGVGPEIGSSALDHDGNIDPEISATKLKSGESIEIAMLFEFLDRLEVEKLEYDIIEYNKRRTY